MGIQCSSLKCKEELDIAKSDSNSSSDLNLSNISQDLRINSSIFVNCNNKNPYDKYSILKVLGEGAYGKVYLVKHKENNTKRAMKEIIKSKKESSIIKNEIEILKRLDHPNVVKIFEYYLCEKNEKCYLITEYCQYGELMKKITKNAPYDEYFSAFILYQLLSAVFYCHSNNIIHRDIKPENILIDGYDLQGYYLIKLIDYGNAKIFKKNQNEKKVIGSCYYIAPEVLNKNYNEKCDLWSCGVILFLLLTGILPFNGMDRLEIISKILKGEYDKNELKPLSFEAQDLISKLMEFNPENRISAGEALNHKWFEVLKIKEKNLVDIERFNTYIQNLLNYKPKFKLQSVVLAFIVYNSSNNEEIKDLIKIFRLMDENGDGKITKEEMSHCLSKYRKNLTTLEINAEVDKIFQIVDTDGSGYVDFQEFVTACISKENLINETVLKNAFGLFDIDGNGEITLKELKDIFTKGTQHLIPEKSLKTIIDEIDTNGDGKISFDEFKSMMKWVK